MNTSDVVAVAKWNYALIGARCQAVALAAVTAVTAVTGFALAFRTCQDSEAHYGRMNAGPQTQAGEIAADIFRMSTWVSDITEHGFTFNHFRSPATSRCR